MLSTPNAASKALDIFLNHITPGSDELRDSDDPELTYQDQERIKCLDPEYFINEYCYIFDTAKETAIPGGPQGGRWIPFKLWEGQITVLHKIVNNQKIIVLKARQNGLTWLCLAYALWQAVFEPIAVILVYSLRDDEAIAMLGDVKMEGMYKRLPDWMRPNLLKKAKHRWEFDNGSSIVALPTTAGDSYTATMAIVDEADLIPDLNDLLQRVKPTIDAGGKLILISRSNKRKPKSLFKKIYKAAKSKLNDFVDIFLPWHARPNRSEEWYEREKASVMAETGVLDNLYESYPATDTEALAPSTLDKRFAYEILNRSYLELDQINILGHEFTGKTPIVAANIPIIPGLRILELPEKGEIYVGGADPAEGNPNSDDSAFSLLHRYTGKQVAVFNGKHEPSVFADYIAKISKAYNNASVLVERNNHGHAVIMACELLKVRLLEGPDGKIGYQSNRRTKVELYDNFAESLKTDDILITDFETFNQLALIEGNTLSAPEGEEDDLADSIALANIGRTLKVSGTGNQSAVSVAKSKGWNYGKNK